MLTDKLIGFVKHFSFCLSSLVFSTECMKLGKAVLSMIVFAYSNNAKKTDTDEVFKYSLLTYTLIHAMYICHNTHLGLHAQKIIHCNHIRNV